MHRAHVSPWVVRGLYLLAVVLMVSPAMDLVTTAWPMRPGELAWRYGFLGLTPGYLHTPILGVVLAMAVAFWRAHPTVLRWTGVLGLVVTISLVVAMAVFALDVVQIRALRDPEVQSGVLAGGILQEIKYITAALVLYFLGIGGLRTAKDLAKAPSAAATGSPGALRRS